MLELEVPWLDDVVRAKRPQRLPVVLTREEVWAVLHPLAGVPRLMAHLLYGAGLRLLECCRLRGQDVDFGSNQIVVRRGSPRPSRGSIRTRPGRGYGNGSSLRRACIWTGTPASGAGTTCTSSCFSAS